MGFKGGDCIGGITVPTAVCQQAQLPPAHSHDGPGDNGVNGTNGAAGKAGAPGGAGGTGGQISLILQSLGPDIQLQLSCDGALAVVVVAASQGRKVSMDKWAELATHPDFSIRTIITEAKVVTVVMAAKAAKVAMRVLAGWEAKAGR